MNYFGRILSFLKPYKAGVTITLLLNLFTVVFSIVSITALIPVLNIIFDATAPQADPVAYSGLGNLREYLEGNLNFWIGQQMELYGKKQVLIQVLVFTGILFILKNLFRYLARVSLTIVQNGVEFDLRTQIHHRILDLDLSFYSRHKKGDLLARVTSDLHEIQWAVLATIHKMVQDPLMILGTLAALFLLSAKLTLFVLVLFPFAAVLISYVGKKLKKPSERAKSELGKIVSLMEEHLSGLLVIKSFHVEDRMKAIFEESNDLYKKNMNHMLFLRDLSSPISEVLGFLVIAALVWYGGYLILDDKTLEASVFIVYILMFYQIINPAKSFTQAIYNINRAEASSKRVLDLIHTENAIRELPMAGELTSIQEYIQFDHVWFKYNDDWVIKDLSLQIPVGKTTALVGQSGSGKSTLLSLISRFYDVQKGSVLVDGKDIKTLTKKSLRKQFGYIAQDSILFHDTIQANLQLAKEDATLEEMKEALQIANAWDFVSEFPAGLQTIVGDRGSTLSGGQRQRIAIARAVLKNPPILLLDEATSALDSESERAVQEAFDRLLQGRTAIVVAHRLSTIQAADQIIVMKEGEIIEQGQHRGLVELGGEYCKFVELQNV